MEKYTVSILKAESSLRVFHDSILLQTIPTCNKGLSRCNLVNTEKCFSTK